MTRPRSLPPSWVALAICSRDSGPGCYLQAPGWHLSRAGDLRMGTWARDAGGRAGGCLLSVTERVPLPPPAQACLDMLGLAWQ